MAKKVVAIIGTYRKGGITDQIVKEMLRAAADQGAQTSTIHLLDKHIEFCTNCRTCTQQADAGTHGKCIHDDDMEAILAEIDAADGIVLASPTNFFTVTALMKRCIERLVCYAYWPWQNGAPRLRRKQATKKAVIVTSTACPAFLARLLMPGSPKLLKITAKTFGAKVVDKIYFGMVATEQRQRLTEKQKRRAYKAGLCLVS
ncbi:MAG: flavodoxin family protein [Sedimentisphaerales bacterium]|nr:flavodoxin family protein [Sedimentisphaerales bacterium]